MIKKWIEKQVDKRCDQWQKSVARMDDDMDKHVLAHKEFSEKMVAHNKLVEGWLKAFMTKHGVEVP